MLPPAMPALSFDLAMLYLTGRFGVDKKAEALPLLAAAAGQKDNRMP